MEAPLNECNQWLHFWEISNFSHRRCEFLTRRIPQTNCVGSRTALPVRSEWGSGGYVVSNYKAQRLRWEERFEIWSIFLPTAYYLPTSGTERVRHILWARRSGISVWRGIVSTVSVYGLHHSE